MDEFLMMLLEKYLNCGIERIIAEEHLYSEGRILVEKIKLFCRLIENNSKRSEKSELYDLIRNIDGLMLKVKQLKLAVQKERLDFSRFQKNVETDWKAANLTKTKIEENLTEKLAVHAEKHSSKILIRGLEHETRKRSIEIETKLFEQRLKCMGEARYSKQRDLYQSRFKASKRCLEQLERYDINVEALYTCKSTLLADKDSIEKQYSIVQDQLIAQRSLYNRLKEEWELNAKQAFLTKLECFRRNRAAKIIQRTWRFYTVRASWRKRKGKK